MSEQLTRWTGKFGREYTDRNDVDWHTRVDGFRQMIPPDVSSVLEVGCNRGHNLVALAHALGTTKVWGCEPAKYARKKARLTWPGICDCSIYDVGLKHNDSHKLTMTSGVLIHVPPGRLPEALMNMYAASYRYVLAIEYYAANDTVIEYRGHDDMLWKRDYCWHYQRLFPDLKLIGTGDGIPGFDGATYWLFEK